jgi:large subunit ribosomal protein L28
LLSAVGSGSLCNPENERQHKHITGDSDMAKVCQVTLKAPQSGHNVSHANNKTKRRFLPNLQVRRFWVESLQQFVKLRVSTQGIRIIDKLGIETVLQQIKERESA